MCFTINLQLRLQSDTLLKQLIQRINTCLHDLLILRWRTSTRADSSNEFAFEVKNRQAASKGCKSAAVCVVQPSHSSVRASNLGTDGYAPVSSSTRPHSFFVEMCTCPVASCCESFIHRNTDAGYLRTGHAGEM
jgi:hypothetical protein